MSEALYAAGLRAARLIEAGRPAEAVRVLAADCARGRGWALLLRARAKLALGRERLAVADCTRAFDADRACGWLLGRGAAPDPQAARLAETQKAFASSLEAWPARAWFGKLAAMEGRGAEALAELDAAVAGAPRQAYARAWRGEARRRLGDARGAREDYEAALALDAREPIALVGRARLKLADGDAAGALADADAAARAARGYEEAPLEGARACLALGDAAGALRRLEAACARAGRYGWRSLGAAADALERMSSDPALRARPWRARLLAWRGEALLSAGDAAGARAALEQALSLEPALAWARGFWGEALAALGRRREAEAALRRALAAKRPPSRAALALGRLRLEADPRGAARAFSRCLALDATWLAAFCGRAEARARLRDRAGAAEDAAAAWRLDPRSRDLASLAERLAALGDFDAAACALGGRSIGFEAALRNTPSHQLMYSFRPWADGAAPVWLERALAGTPPLRAAAGAALCCLGRHEEALAALDAAVAARPWWPAGRLARAAARLFSARARRSNDALGDCLEDLDAALKGEAEDGRALRLRAEIRSDRDDFDGARADLERALRLDPRDDWARVELADLLADRGRAREALAHLRKLAARPREGWYWAVMGRGRALAGDRRAVADLDRAVRLSPGSASVLGWRGEARRKARRYAAALADFDRALSLDPGFVYVHEWRARLLLMLGRPAEALESAEQVRALDPRHVYGPSYAAEALFKLGRFREACETLERVHPMDPRSFWSPRVAEGKAPASVEKALRADLDAAAAARPDDAWARAFRGRCLATLGEPAAARADLELALALDPGCAYARLWLARLDARGVPA